MVVIAFGASSVSQDSCARYLILVGMLFSLFVSGWNCNVVLPAMMLKRDQSIRVQSFSV